MSFVNPHGDTVSGREYVNSSCAAKALAMGEREVGVRYLPVPRLTTQLLHRLDDLCDAGGTQGMTLGEQPTTRAHLYPRRREPLFNETTSLAARAESQILVVDDLIATGGTLKAACSLIEEAGAEVKGIFSVIGLPFLKYHEILADYDVKTLIDYDSE